MLFDLRARGRRSVVRVIYIGLALIFLLGAVGFGVGGGFGSGGVADIFTSNEGSGSASFSREIAKYRKLTQKEPGNAGAWEQLTKALLHEAGGEAYVSRTGVVTGKGKELYKQAAQAWAGYIALNPAKPNAELAQQMVNIYGEQGLNEPAEAVKVLQIAIATRPIARYYYELAQYAYKAHNVRIGDLAAKKTLSLLPAAERTRVKTQLAELKKNPSGEQTFTTTTNGKTYTGKLNSKGEVQATEAKTTPPAGKSTKK
jgi:hypothetical protein